MDEMIYERESDAPADWQGNRIFVRDGKGDVVEIDVPDDTEEVTSSVTDD